MLDEAPEIVKLSAYRGAHPIVDKDGDLDTVGDYRGNPVTGALRLSTFRVTSDGLRVTWVLDTTATSVWVGTSCAGRSVAVVTSVAASKYLNIQFL